MARLLALLDRERPLYHKLADIVLLGQVVQLADVVGTLRSEPARYLRIGQPGNVLLSLAHNDQRQSGQVLVDDATAHRLALTLAGTARTIARVSLLQQQTNTGGRQHALLHRETLLVVATGNLHDVALPFIAQEVRNELGAHALLEEVTQLMVIRRDVEGLLSPRRGKRYVQLHFTRLFPYTRGE
uniref:Putative 40s ribosomal protein s6 n=1 Tax=Anopheles braziliensis TaxID=58242 RepID=A0A2M3YXH6_9DIPT